jgi:hypothetical protein
MVACREAEVHELVGAERLRLSWLTHRAWRTGNLWARRSIALSPQPFAARVRLVVRAAATAGVSAVAVVVAWRARDRARWLLRGVSALGQVSGVLGRTVTGY